MQRRVFVSAPDDHHLNESQINFKWGLIERIEKEGLFAELIANPRREDGFAAGETWSPEVADDIARRCDAGLLIGLPRWTLKSADGSADYLMATEYCQYEGALMKMLGIPVLGMLQQGVSPRGVFDHSFGEQIVRFPADAGADWLNAPEFQSSYRKWRAKIDRRRDVFLGYCSGAEEVARKIKNAIVGEIGASVLDWQTDFESGGTILDEIREAAARCKTGVFLFTRDDLIGSEDAAGDGDARQAIPRDNVVFEAGYFMSLKGPKQVLMIRESGTKMPADVGGHIYARLVDRNDIGPLKDALRKFLSRL